MVLLTLAVTFVGGAVGATGPTVTASDAETDVGATTNVTLVLSEAPEGVSGFGLNVSVADRSVAEIADIRLAGSFASVGDNDPQVYDGGTAAYASASDFERNYEAGATDVPLVTVELAGVGEGRTALNVARTDIDNDNGDNIDPTVRNVTVTVGNVTTPPTATPDNETAPNATTGPEPPPRAGARPASASGRRSWRPHCSPDGAASSPRGR